MWAIESTQDRAIRLLADQSDFERRASFEYRWSVWPRRCYRSQRRIWGRAVRAEAVWTGPGEPIVEQRWLHRDEGLILLIKRSANGTV
jgi:hypothetical protein